jgi:outer membrane protein assembly factor BamB
LSYKTREKRKKLKNFKSKTVLSTLAILMVLSFTVSIFALPGTVSAQSTDNITTYPFVDAIPNPVGVGQKCLINFGLLNFLAEDGDGWNVTVTITDPEGHVTTIGPLKTWSTGTVGQYFTPEIVGTYQIQCHFEGEYYNSTSPRVASGYYAPSETDVLELTVTEDQVDLYPGQSLPSEYWTRPIDSQLREWWSVAGSWASKPDNLYAPYNDAPETAHILWTMPMGDTNGGLVGGDTGDHGYQNGDAYEGKFAGSVIISGVLYYNRYVSGAPTQTIVAVDLHTGETLWENNYTFGGGRISIGQTLYWDCLNSRGAFSYIWLVSGTNWYGVDAESGILRYNMTNVPSGTNYIGPNGEIMKYSIVNYGNSSNPDYRLLQWNSSYVVTKGKVGMSESWGSQTQGVTYDATERGYDLNVSIPSYNSAAAGVFPSSGNTTIQKAFVGDRVILTSVDYNNVQIWALDLTRGSEGALLFNKVNAAPAEWAEGFITISSIGQAGWAAWSQEDMVAIFFSKENRVHYAYSLDTGEFLWETEPQVYADAWADTVLASFGPDRVIAYNKLYSATVGGIVYCYDICNGTQLWNYTANDPYHESYLTNNWWIMPLFVSDGKIYFGSLEHSALDPKPRGAPFFALDAETGDLIWRADGLFRQTRWGGRAIIGDSIIATMDTYDQQIYGIGKGPSTTTLSAPDTAVEANTAVMIKGTIMDNSPGTESDALQLRFPNGVPVVSDESQSAWMLYVYKQFSQPMDATGVSISIDATDPNGNSVHLGDTTSDASGQFYFEFTPTTEGKYTIYATFMGSEAYYSSYAQNALTVSAAQAAPTTATVSNTPYELYTIGMGVAIIIAVALVGLLILKKK